MERCTLKNLNIKFTAIIYFNMPDIWQKMCGVWEGYALKNVKLIKFKMSDFTMRSIWKTRVR